MSLSTQDQCTPTQQNCRSRNRCSPMFTWCIMFAHFRYDDSTLRQLVTNLKLNFTSQYYTSEVGLLSWLLYER